MTLNELANTLKQMYETAPGGEQVAMIHLFGIKYAEEIKAAGYAPKDIVQAAEMQPSYATEVNKGMKLAAYVTVKNL